MKDFHEQTIVIEAREGWGFPRWGELRDYRDLLYFLVFRDIRIRYQQSALGVGWAIIQPLFTMVIFTIVFGKVAKIDSNGVPYALFSLTALVPWTYFSNALVDSSNSLITNAGILSKIYFPRPIIPLAPTLAKLLDFSISMVMLAIVMAIFKWVPTVGIVVLPLLIAIMCVAACGLGMFLSALAVQYRDVKFALQFLIQLMMYASPVVYSVTKVPAQYRELYALNPMVGVIEGFRAALLGTTPMPWDLIGIGAAVAVAIFLVSSMYFTRLESRFADVA